MKSGVKENSLFRADLEGVMAGAEEDGNLRYYFDVKALKPFGITPTASSNVKWELVHVPQKGSVVARVTRFYPIETSRDCEVMKKQGKKPLSMQTLPHGRASIQVQSKRNGKWKKLIAVPVHAWVYSDGMIEVNAPHGLTLREMPQVFKERSLPKDVRVTAAVRVVRAAIEHLTVKEISQVLARVHGPEEVLT